MPIWLREKLFQEHLLRDELRRFASDFQPKGKLVFAEHHLSHAASAFFPSPFNEAVILTMDGVGEWATATLGYGSGNKISLTHEMRFPHSLGLFYQALTQYLGFPHYGDEYKVMGLAPYGQPRQLDAMRKIVRLLPGGSFELEYKT